MYIFICLINIIEYIKHIEKESKIFWDEYGGI
jgi:hypothetical protein